MESQAVWSLEATVGLWLLLWVTQEITGRFWTAKSCDHTFILAGSFWQLCTNRLRGKRAEMNHLGAYFNNIGESHGWLQPQCWCESVRSGPDSGYSLKMELAVFFKDRNGVGGIWTQLWGFWFEPWNNEVVIYWVGKIVGRACFEGQVRSLFSFCLRCLLAVKMDMSCRALVDKSNKLGTN